MNAMINGRTPEEIKRGLECCALGECDNGCPYFEKMLKCTDKNMDALTLINQLQEDKRQLERERDEARNDLDAISYANTELYSAYDAMKRERDAAMELLKQFECNSCIHENVGAEDKPCVNCIHNYAFRLKSPLVDNWQWHGPQEVDN